MLDKNELKFATALIKSTPSGRYVLRLLYGDNWTWRIRPKSFGRRFRLSVRHDDLPGIRWVGKKSGSALYEVLPRLASESSITGYRPSKAVGHEVQVRHSAT